LTMEQTSKWCSICTFSECFQK